METIFGGTKLCCSNWKDKFEKSGIVAYLIFRIFFFFFFFFERMRDTDDSVNLLKFLEDSKKYFEELLVWKETKKEFHLPIRNFKPKRHEKVHETAKPIGW